MSLPLTDALGAWWDAENIGASHDVPQIEWHPEAGSIHTQMLHQITTSKQPLFKNNMYNSQDALDFDGTDDSMITDTISAITRNLGGLTIYTVIRPDVASGSRCIVNFSTATTSATRVGIFLVDGKVTIAGRRLDSDGYVSWTFPNGPVLTGVGNRYIVSVEWNFAGNRAEAFVDGASIGSVSWLGAGTTSDTSGHTRVGVTASNTTEFYNGMLSQLIVFKRVHTASERAQINTYLSDRYAITVADYGQGGTLFREGSITASGVAVRQPRKPLAGFVTIGPGVYYALRVITRNPVGTINAAGLAFRSFARTYGGSSRPAGALVQRLPWLLKKATVTIAGVSSRRLLRMVYGVMQPGAAREVLSVGRSYGRGGVVALSVRLAGIARIRVRRGF